MLLCLVLVCFAVLVETTGSSNVEACNDEACRVGLQLLDNGGLLVEFHGEVKILFFASTVWIWFCIVL